MQVTVVRSKWMENMFMVVSDKETVENFRGYQMYKQKIDICMYIEKYLLCKV